MVEVQIRPGQDRADIPAEEVRAVASVGTERTAEPAVFVVFLSFAIQRGEFKPVSVFGVFDVLVTDKLQSEPAGRRRGNQKQFRRRGEGSVVPRQKLERLKTFVRSVAGRGAVVQLPQVIGVSRSGELAVEARHAVFGVVIRAQGVPREDVHHGFPCSGSGGARIEVGRQRVVKVGQVAVDTRIRSDGAQTCRLGLFQLVLADRPRPRVRPVIFGEVFREKSLLFRIEPRARREDTLGVCGVGIEIHVHVGREEFHFEMIPFVDFVAVVGGVEAFVGLRVAAPRRFAVEDGQVHHVPVD